MTDVIKVGLRLAEPAYTPLMFRNAWPSGLKR